MKLLYIKILLFIFILVPCLLFSQNKQWVGSPFEQKVFIENKGQFDNIKELRKQQVLYSTISDGVELFFTPQGLVYKHDKYKASIQDVNESELTEADEREHEEKERKANKPKPEFFSMEWVGANPKTEIVSENPVTFYYTYGDQTNAIKAKAFKKIIYKSLYPNIDVEYVFPEGKQGIKYSIILHPGADPSLIKMKYADAESIQINSNGDATLKSSFGNFVDHAPKTYTENGKLIHSSFALNKKIISFNLPHNQQSIINNQKIVIDPWTTNPAFTIYNSAYDLNYDLNGNVYVYGSINEFKLAKFNSAGALQWIYSVTGSSYSQYCDFVVDEVTGTSYTADSYHVYKTNTLGNNIGSYNVNTADPNGDIPEFWRMEYNRCVGKIVIGGGSALNYYQGAILDTNLTNITNVSVLSTTEKYHDVSLLAIDNTNKFAFMGSASYTWSSFKNNILKCPLPNLLPITYSVPNGHQLFEIASVLYVNHQAFITNGMNGIAVSPRWLYTYDSDSLKRWDKNSGALSSTIDVSPSPPVMLGSIAFGNSRIQVLWGGLAVDECDNIFVGMGNTIKEYNSSLTLINTFNLPDTIYDLKLGSGGKLYACGKGFATEITIPPNNTTVTVTPTPSASCSSCTGSASVTTLSCGGDGSGFNYTWSTSPPQTTQTATGLCPGTYSVTLTSNCYSQFNGTTTIAGGGAPFVITTSNTPANCGSNNGSATASTNGTNTPYTYTWNTNQTGATITNLSSGIYTVTAYDAQLCSSTATVQVANVGGAVLAANPTTPVKCNGGNDGTAGITISSGGTTPFTYSWSNGVTQTTASVTGLSAATYTVTVTDANNCISTLSFIISEPNAIAPTVSSTTATCGNSNGSATASATNGTSPYTYTWSNSMTGASVSNLSSAIYTVTVYDSQACSKTTTVSVANVSGPAIPPATFTNVLCNGLTNGSASINVSGGTTPYIYSWTGTTNATASANNLGAGTYTIHVTDGNNCTNSVSVQITEPTVITATTGTIVDANCGASNGSASINVSGGTSPYTYSWSPSGGNTAGLSSAAAGTYVLTITDAATCSKTTSVTINNIGGATLSVLSNLPAQCNGGNDGSGSITASGGKTPYTYSWSSGVTSTTSSASGLASGNYTVTVKDANSCQSTTLVSITEPSAITGTPTANNAACDGVNDGTASISVTGGNGTTYTYSWSTGETTKSISNLASGTYTVKIIDSKNCTKTTTVSVGKNGGPTVYAGLDSTITLGSSIQLGASGNGNTYLWSPPTELSCTICQNPIASPKVDTWYIVTTTDSKGCKDSDSLYITVETPCGDIFIPTAFSPNDDGINDVFMARGKCMKEFLLQVFNRWGEIVFETNDVSKGWNGIFRGQPENSGVFVFVLKGKTLKGDEFFKKGNVTLVR